MDSLSTVLTDGEAALGRMCSMTSAPQRCAACGSELPDGSTKRRKYCSDRCRFRAHKRKRRAAQRIKPTQLEAARAKLQALETAHARARDKLDAARAEVAKLQAAERKRDRAVTGQVLHISTAGARTRMALRDQLAEVTEELRAVTSRSVSQDDLDAAAHRIVDGQRKLTALRSRYDRLADAYRSLKEVTTDLAADRRRFALVVDQWQKLATGLVRKHMSGQKLNAVERSVVDTWSRWESARRSRDRQPADRSGGTSVRSPGQTPVTGMSGTGGHGDRTQAGQSERRGGQ